MAQRLLVVTPALPNRLDWLASATDRAREQADERLVALRPDEEAGWQEQGLIEQRRERFGLPTTVFEVQPSSG